MMCSHDPERFCDDCPTSHLQAFIQKLKGTS